LPILLMAAAMFAQSQPLHLTLRDAEEMALKQNPQVRIANLNTAVTQTTQACDRFQAGVANNIEVITAQDELARANDNQIVALYRYNPARTDLAHATGQMESLYPK
jgi:outer membrane protein